ncbi:helix-turn-helix domain-containing protein [Streptomyces sp. H39-S7]|uniref:helix-turn-helix domain-containing protein n=1 Tax=Streptomyces sp. H39-S7 TaxID=3004357 RepID=UPI0022AF66A2|nr:helix-turn-helix transcriptional regulator [Streptomyces sp. H39-S7]MCZ4123367.1 helix-turn-helix transcriptional regulator [Streptomyces sp. H39-S7]
MTTNSTATPEELTATRYRLFQPERLRMLMERTGDGSEITIRVLAKAAGVHSSRIGELLSGKQHTTSARVAERVAARCGVDLLVLWVPDGRTTSSVAGPAARDARS